MEKVFYNKYGYYELKSKPDSTELEKYYAEKYYQKSMATYKKQYNEEEIKFIKNRLSRKQYICDLMLPKIKKNFLDIGCGEGWALNYFYNTGWEVIGLDYSDNGCKRHNPDMLPYFVKGDIHRNLKKLIDERSKYQIILMDNVLEHVLDPEKLLTDLRLIANKETVLIIEVPNDFSDLQKHLLENGNIDEQFWVVSPDHISYFNKDGLNNLMNASGWKVKYLSTDYPIDINLLNPDTNYNKDKSKGRNVHLARVKMENFLSNKESHKVMQLYESLADLGLGRNIIGYYKIHEDE